MKHLVTKNLTICLVALFLPVIAMAQSTGDFRSAASGNWTATATWETFDGSSWVAATSAPDGSETITIRSTDSVSVDANASITGYVTVSDTAELVVSDGITLEFGEGSTYEHSRDGGDIPTATWGSESTFMLTGTALEAPGNRGQDYFNVIINTPDHTGNKDLSLGGHTISGDFTVVETGGSRWRLIGGDSGTITIMGDVIVQGGSLETLGTGSPTQVVVEHYGDINVTGGTFAISRGSQGSGTGSTTWNLRGGNFSISNATTRNSNPTNAKFVFAGNATQTIAFDNVDFEGNSINYDISDSSIVEIADGASEVDLLVTGTMTNYGEVVATGALAIDGDGTYNHARDIGEIPDATWMEGSTIMFTGLVSDEPDNRQQDYWNVVFDSPNLNTNASMNFNGQTIGGDITVKSSGESRRWQLFGGGSANTITILGDVIIEDGSFTTTGSGSATDNTVHHYGNVVATGGNFSISRSSSSTGNIVWNFYGDSFTADSVEMQNSTPEEATAKWVFAKSGDQTITLNGVDYGSSRALNVEVSDSTTLDLGSNELEESGFFIANDGATLVTAHSNGLSGNLQTDGEITIGSGVNVMYNGTETQSSGLAAVTDSVGGVWVANEAGVNFNDMNNDTLYAALLNVAEFTAISVSVDSADSTGAFFVGSGSVSGSIVNSGIFEVSDTLSFSSGSSYEHAVDGGEIPTGFWSEGSTLLITGTETEGPDNGDQNFHNVTLNTPNNVTNNYLGMVNKTLSGDLHTISTGLGRWYISGGISPSDTSDVWIMGNIIHENGNFSVQGTGTADTHYRVHVNGDITVTGGNFSVSRGSQGSGTGTTNWYLMGDFSISDAESQNSNSDNANWVFVNTEEPSVLTLNNVSINGSGMQIIVADSALLDLGNSEIDSGGDFTTNAGSTIYTANEGGLDSTFQITGTLSLSSQANYTFNGTVPQVTSFKLPLSVHGLTIDNAAGVLQSRDITINGFLRLANGVFDNSLGLFFGANAEVIYEDGSLLIPIGGLPIPEPPYEIGDILSYNGSFEFSDIAATAPDAWTISSSANSTVAVTDEAQDDDSRGLQMNIAWDGSTNWYITEAVNEPLNVVEGETYEASVWLKADSDTRQAQFYLGTPEAGGYSRARGFPTPTTTLSTDWQEVTFIHTVTAEEAAVGMRLGVEVNAEANDGGTIYLDNLSLTRVEGTPNEGEDRPLEFRLSQNYPNPFNPSTNISYEIPEASQVAIKIFDVMGRQVAELVNEQQSPGTYTINWDASGLASGMYLYRITAGNFTAVKTLTLIK